MNRLLYLFIFLPLLVACDNIDEDDRYIETGPVEVSRKVLLEEFTGQRCVNCPDAHRIIESLEEQYGDNLIAVSIHAGPFGISSPRGLMQPEGNEYASHWNISSYPAGVVDRTGSAETMNQWAASVRRAAEETTDLQLSLEAQLNEDSKNIEIFTTMVTPENLTGSLQLWVIESNIRAMQISGDETIQDYVHNNVFRACVNGLWGEEIPLEKHVVKYVSNTIEVNSSWKLDNISIVGFYYNTSGVIQVERVNLANI